MSGGAFDYKNFHINEIAEDIQKQLDRQGKERDKYELYMQDEFYEKYPEEKIYPTFDSRVQHEMKNAVKLLKLASIYAHRVDYFLSGDDGEENFLERLNSEIKELGYDNIRSALE